MNAIETASMWRNLGIACIPILAKSKRPALPSWREYQHRLPTSAEIVQWWATDYNLAVVLGWRNLFVIDWDDFDAYDEWKMDLDGKLSELVTLTYQVNTHRGKHIYLIANDEKPECWKGQDFDIKGDGGYVLGPPSIHPSGHRYRGEMGELDIGHVNTIRELFPDYNPPPTFATILERDPFDVAMRRRTNGVGNVGISIADIKARVSIEDLLPGANWRGSNRHKMTLCPLHDDHNPSFHLYADGHARCYGCGWRGDVIDLYEALNGLERIEAMRELAGRI